METDSITTSDGVRLVYDLIGSGPPLMLLHGGGGGQNRKSWVEAGYVDRLKSQFTLIVPDIRGHGESDRPFDPNSYSIERMCQDILELADAAGLDRFPLWGFSYGGNIGRFLAETSTRISQLIMIGIPFGPAVSDNFKSQIKGLTEPFGPAVDAYRAGNPHEAYLTAEQIEIWREHNVPVLLSWLTAMLSWGENRPHDLRCRSLWVIGDQNKSAYDDLANWDLAGSPVEAFIVEGLDHSAEFDQIDQVLPKYLHFMESDVNDES